MEDPLSLKNGAGDGIRTRGCWLGKPVPYHLATPAFLFVGYSDARESIAWSHYSNKAAPYHDPKNLSYLQQPTICKCRSDTPSLSLEETSIIHPKIVKSKYSSIYHSQLMPLRLLYLQLDSISFPSCLICDRLPLTTWSCFVKPAR